MKSEHFFPCSYFHSQSLRAFFKHISLPFLPVLFHYQNFFHDDIKWSCEWQWWENSSRCQCRWKSDNIFSMEQNSGTCTSIFSEQFSQHSSKCYKIYWEKKKRKTNLLSNYWTELHKHAIKRKAKISCPSCLVHSIVWNYQLSKKDEHFFRILRCAINRLKFSTAFSNVENPVQNSLPLNFVEITRGYYKADTPPFPRFPCENNRMPH